MKLAIHNRPNSYSERWIKYCRQLGIAYKLVNCFDTNLIKNIEDVNGVLWHWTHEDFKAQLAARQVTKAIEEMGIKVFPSSETCWHYDDKIAQKYLLEAIGAPLVPTSVFYAKEDALDWINQTNFPVVFKLRSGAGSSNVRLVRNKRTAIKLCDQMFGKGIVLSSSYFRDYKTKSKKIENTHQFLNKLKRMPKELLNISMKKRLLPVQKGYVYFQEFLPNNTYDTRITVIGNRAFGYIRMTRTNDFRASGSGNNIYDKNKIDKKCLKIAFDTVDKLKSQSVAFDFIYDRNREPKICEISYCYVSKYIHNCSGYWDRDLVWHKGSVWPEEAILDDFIQWISIDNNK